MKNLSRKTKGYWKISNENKCFHLKSSNLGTAFELWHEFSCCPSIKGRIRWSRNDWPFQKCCNRFSAITDTLMKLILTLLDVYILLFKVKPGTNFDKSIHCHMKTVDKVKKINKQVENNRFSLSRAIWRYWA